MPRLRSRRYTETARGAQGARRAGEVAVPLDARPDLDGSPCARATAMTFWALFGPSATSFDPMLRSAASFWVRRYVSGRRVARALAWTSSRPGGHPHDG